MVGDTTADIQFAKNAGLRSVLVKTGAKGEDGLYDVKADLEIEKFADLAAYLG